MGLKSLEELRTMPEWDIITWLIRREVPRDDNVLKALGYRRRQNQKRQEKGLKPPSDAWQDSFIGVQTDQENNNPNRGKTHGRKR